MPSLVHREHRRTVAPSRYLEPLSDRRRERDDDGDEDDDMPIDTQERQPPSEPTFLIPGTEEKIVLLAARYEAGMELWHEGDLTLQCIDEIESI